MKLSDTFYIYTDASFSPADSTAIIGYVLFKSTLEHETAATSSVASEIAQIQESSGIRAELRGAISGLSACSEVGKVVLFTDCQTICHLPRRREKLEKSGFISQSKGRVLANSDLYQKFYSICDAINPQIEWLKGHTPRRDQSFQQKHFSYLDQAVRRALRAARP